LITSKEPWSHWGDRKLAEELNCSFQTVRRYRFDDSGIPGKRMGRDGKMYMVTKSKKPKPEILSVEPPPVGTSEVPEGTSQKTLAEAKAKAKRLLEMITILFRQINDWLDLAPAELHEEFSDRLWERIIAMID
jgi:hypothetical protein